MTVEELIKKLRQIVLRNPSASHYEVYNAIDDVEVEDIIEGVGANRIEIL